MNTKQTIEYLEREWDFDNGFFGLLRRGEFDAARLDRLDKLLSVLDYEDEEFVNHRIVSLLWYIPLFMSWQRERVLEYEKCFAGSSDDPICCGRAECDS